MENEYENAQNRLDAIKKVLVDSDKALPAPAGMFYAIGISTIFLDVVVDKIFASRGCDFNLQLITALITLTVVFLLTVFASKIFVKKENEKLERIFSRNQCFIFQIYGILLAIGVAVTMGLVTLGGCTLVYFYWTAILGIGAYIFGFFTKKLISRYGLFLIFTAILQIMAAVVYISLSGAGGNETLKYHADIYTLGQYSSILLVGFGHILIGYLLGKAKNV